MFQLFSNIFNHLTTAGSRGMIAAVNNIDCSKGLDGNLISIVILIILVVIALVVSVFVYKENVVSINETETDSEDGTIRERESDSTGDKNFDKIVKDAGYGYDLNQDIFYSRINSWQRKYGYCTLYDEAAAPLGMIIDCEPIYFEHEGKKWLIEFWKGQYDLTSGGEIGVYKEKESNIKIQGVFLGDFYEAVSNEQLLDMSYELKSEDKVIFTRAEKHWWLTGFKLGDFFNPSDLVMNLTIKFNNEDMQNAFINGLKKVGYLEEEIIINNDSVSVCFDKPHSRQPYTRGGTTDKIIQKKNKFLCDEYQEITKPYTNFKDKLAALKSMSPELYNEIMNIGKTKALFEEYNSIKRYLK